MKRNFHTKFLREKRSKGNWKVMKGMTSIKISFNSQIQVHSPKAPNTEWITAYCQARTGHKINHLQTRKDLKEDHHILYVGIKTHKCDNFFCQKELRLDE